MLLQIRYWEPGHASSWVVVKKLKIGKGHLWPLVCNNLTHMIYKRGAPPPVNIALS